VPILRDWELKLDVDQVIRGQGADPEVIRSRSPQIVDLAQNALQEGRSYLRPVVLWEAFLVDSLRHERLILQGDRCLQGPLIAQHMASVSRVVVMLCSIGHLLEEHASHVMTDDLAYGLALDGVGSAATEALANEACHLIEEQAQGEGLNTTTPLSPGMAGWTVKHGQEQIFALLDGETIGVKLNSSGVMTPRKSLSMALGLGHDVGHTGSPCDYCSMRENCRYQDHYA